MKRKLKFVSTLLLEYCKLIPMLTIPLYVLLVAYALFLLVFVAFMVANIYHISASASFTFLGTLVTVALIAVGTLVVLLTFYYLQGVDWTLPIVEVNIDWIIAVFQAKGDPSGIPNSF